MSFWVGFFASVPVWGALGAFVVLFVQWASWRNGAFDSPLIVRDNTRDTLDDEEHAPWSDREPPLVDARTGELCAHSDETRPNRVVRSWP